MLWSNVGGALESQDAQTLSIATVDFQTITQGQQFLWFG